jgi:hypothetical protein
MQVETGPQCFGRKKAPANPGPIGPMDPGGAYGARDRLGCVSLGGSCVRSVRMYICVSTVESKALGIVFVRVMIFDYIVITESIHFTVKRRL